jgi:uncharacterized protein
MRHRSCLAIMARVPMAGKGPIKTRLGGSLPCEDDRVALYRAFLVDLIAMARRLEPIALRMAFTPSDAGDVLSALGIEPRERLPQRGGDLGSRERHVFEDLFAAGFSEVVLIGSDLPTLPRAHLVHAFQRLGVPGRAAVLGPSEDGGYYLMGLRNDGPIPDLFSNVRWSTRHAMDDTVSAAERCGLAVHLVPAWYDVDDEEGLRRLREDLRDPATGARAPATTAALRRLRLDDSDT